MAIVNYGKKNCSAKLKSNGLNDREQEEVNEWRVEIGLEPILRIKKICLTCKKEFLAYTKCGHFNCGCLGYEKDNFTY